MHGLKIFEADPEPTQEPPAAAPAPAAVLEVEVEPVTPREPEPAMEEAELVTPVKEAKALTPISSSALNASRVSGRAGRDEAPRRSDRGKEVGVGRCGRKGGGAEAKAAEEARLINEKGRGG